MTALSSTSTYPCPMNVWNGAKSQSPQSTRSIIGRRKCSMTGSSDAIGAPTPVRRQDDGATSLAPRLAFIGSRLRAALAGEPRKLASLDRDRRRSARLHRRHQLDAGQPDAAAVADLGRAVAVGEDRGQGTAVGRAQPQAQQVALALRLRPILIIS